MEQLSALGEAQKRVYRLHIDNLGRTWLVAEQPNAGDNIYVEFANHSEGFCGRAVEFELVGQLGKISLVGPWRTTSAALLKATGIDVTNRHATKVNIFTMDGTPLHVEEIPVIGLLNRDLELAQKIANKRGEIVRVEQENSSGSIKYKRNPIRDQTGSISD